MEGLIGWGEIFLKNESNSFEHLHDITLGLSLYQSSIWGHFMGSAKLTKSLEAVGSVYQSLCDL